MRSLRGLCVTSMILSLSQRVHTGLQCEKVSMGRVPVTAQRLDLYASVWLRRTSCIQQETSSWPSRGCSGFDRNANKRTTVRYHSLARMERSITSSYVPT